MYDIPAIVYMINTDFASIYCTFVKGQLDDINTHAIMTRCTNALLFTTHEQKRVILHRAQTQHTCHCMCNAEASGDYPIRTAHTESFAHSTWLYVKLCYICRAQEQREASDDYPIHTAHTGPPPSLGMCHCF